MGAQHLICTLIIKGIFAAACAFAIARLSPLVLEYSSMISDTRLSRDLHKISRLVSRRVYNMCRVHHMYICTKQTIQYADADLPIYSYRGYIAKHTHIFRIDQSHKPHEPRETRLAHDSCVIQCRELLNCSLFPIITQQSQPPARKKKRAPVWCGVVC